MMFVWYCSNFAVLVFKTVAYLYTGSAAMLSEAVHSLADLLNQVHLTSFTHSQHTQHTLHSTHTHTHTHTHTLTLLAIAVSVGVWYSSVD